MGCGWWGAVHALALKRAGGRIRRYFASRNPEHACDFARRFDGLALEGLDGALAEPAVDAVVIALPHDVQAEAAERALRAGKHVLIEKPIATEIDAGERVVRAAQEAGRCLAVAEEYRLSPLVQATAQALREGVLGRVALVQIAAASRHRPAQPWKNRRESMGGGVLIDVGVHYVDILRFWFGEPDTVWATCPPSFNDDFEGEDSVLAALGFEGGPVATIALSWSAYRSPKAPQIEIIGELGSLELRFDRPFLLHHVPLPSDHWSRRLRDALPWRLAKHVGRFLPTHRQHRILVPPADLIGSQSLINDFIDAITLGRSPAVPGVDGLQDLRVVLAAYAAIEGGAGLRLGAGGRSV